MDHDTRTGISVDLHFDTPAPPSDPEDSMMRRFDTVIEIDGEKHEFKGGARHFLACAPGRHTVRVYFLFMKVFGLFRPWGAIEQGRESIDISLVEGEVLHLVYEGGVAWRLGNASLHVEQPQT